jgi:hypothetical protein
MTEYIIIRRFKRQKISDVGPNISYVRVDTNLNCSIEKWFINYWRPKWRQALITDYFKYVLKK